MARTIDEIQQSILAAIAADATLASVATSTSKVAIFRLFTRIVAAAQWTIEVLFDTFKIEIADTLALLKPHSLKWYASTARAFQFGFSLLPDSDLFNNAAATEAQIEASKVVRYVAVVEQVKNLRIKVATLGSDLQPLTSPQLIAFTEYMARVKDAGVKLIIDSLPADKLQLTVDIFYDPVILNNVGQRLDGTQLTPVQSAITKYLQNLPFNGVFVLAYLIDELQQVDGVVIPNITGALASYALFPFTSIAVKYQPDSGYLRFNAPADLVLNFVAQSPLR